MKHVVFRNFNRWKAYGYQEPGKAFTSTWSAAVVRGVAIGLRPRTVSCADRERGLSFGAGTPRYQCNKGRPNGTATRQPGSARVAPAEEDDGWPYV